MKKWRGVLVFLMAALLTGCAVQSAETDGAEDSETASDYENYIVVGFSQVGSESDWRTANTESFRETFTRDNGYYLIYEDAQQKQENQVKAVRNFILQEVDYIILDPIVETGWDAVLKEARDAGIPVILAYRMIKIEDETLYTCWVGSDFFAEGKAAGEWLRDYLESQGRGEEQIQIVTLQGTMNSSAQLGRTEGFAEILAEQNNWVMLEQENGEFTQAKGQEVMQEFLNSYENIDVVVSENDNMTFGAIEAIEASGKTCGPDGEIIVLSFDAVDAALALVEDGKINADFECNPLLGPMVEEIIQCMERGEKPEKIQYVEEVYFDTSMDLEAIRKLRAY